ncbi:hypothetical protein SISNIDRAFT_294907 [Sistotremastrum niveocremeum HHB9708]|uniref:Uncharacterized protein n=2 Tax=Sistotremastraceae TaxID=3402574 RepID=A0A164NJA9_9AGAM|nr:hypothetical protein SISNIDRAFT_294907 [Sistotremastrum niveocremeum HHB9708]KZT41891.1 hypothetical protein SISSUDRAFT_176428 [Sistotremastrum suecicum HHB10207 ss-3]
MAKERMGKEVWLRRRSARVWRGCKGAQRRRGSIARVNEIANIVGDNPARVEDQRRKRPARSHPSPERRSKHGKSISFFDFLGLDLGFAAPAFTPRLSFGFGFRRQIRVNLS